MHNVAESLDLLKPIHKTKEPKKASQRTTKPAASKAESTALTRKQPTRVRRPSAKAKQAKGQEDSL